MASEIRKPFTLSIQIDSVHSGSISFGRFESEALCWERSSSFSRNRYLEEVEKCSTPGSVKEKKAYLEAHFRKKGFPGLNSPDCKYEKGYQISETDILDKKKIDEEIDRMTALSDSANSDETLDSSFRGGEEEVFETSFSERLANESTDNADGINIAHLKVGETDDIDLGSSPSIKSASGIEMKDRLDGETTNLDTSHALNMLNVLCPSIHADEENPNASPKDLKDLLPKEQIPSVAECMKPILMPRVSVDKMRRNTSSHASEASERKAHKTAPLESEAEKTSATPKNCLRHKIPTAEPGSKTKGVEELNSAVKESGDRTIVEPQSSTLQKVFGRVHQSANRIKPAVCMNEPDTQQDNSRLSSKRDVSSQRTKGIDSIHSSSISFARFESEALCSERCSSFSHDRFYEEVEQCSKSGSVSEKKAYFEAHFRKKGFLGLNSTECQYEKDYQTSKNDISDKKGNDEEIDHTTASSHSAHFDESVHGSLHGGEQEVLESEIEVFGTSNSKPQIERIELAKDSTTNADGINIEHVKVGEAYDIELESLLSIKSTSRIEMTDKLDGETTNSDKSDVSNMVNELCPDIHADEENPNASQDLKDSSPKEQIPSEAECKKLTSMPQVSVDQRRRHTASHASKASEKKAYKTAPLRSEAQKTSAASKNCLGHKISKFKPGSETGVNELNSAEKESTKPHSSALQKASHRVHQSANRFKPDDHNNNPEPRQDSSRLSFKRDVSAQRMKEENNKAEIKQLRKSLNFKALPLPSFYRAAPHVPDGAKAITSNNKPQKLHSDSSNPGRRVSKSSPSSAKAGTEHATLRTAPLTRTTDPPMSSRAASCHLTLTSDRCASSPAGTNQMCKGKDNLVSLCKHKASGPNQMCKGKTSDAK